MAEEDRGCGLDVQHGYHIAAAQVHDRIVPVLGDGHAWAIDHAGGEGVDVDGVVLVVASPGLTSHIVPGAEMIEINKYFLTDLETYWHCEVREANTGTRLLHALSHPNHGIDGQSETEIGRKTYPVPNDPAAGAGLARGAISVPDRTTAWINEMPRQNYRFTPTSKIIVTGTVYYPITTDRNGELIYKNSTDDKSNPLSNLGRYEEKRCSFNG